MATGELCLFKWARAEELLAEREALLALAEFTYVPGRSASLSPLPTVLEIDGQTILRRPFLKGRTLQHLVRHGPLASARVRRWIASLAGLLAQIHAAGQSHGDVSPSNLLLTEEGELVLLDWGGHERFTPEFCPPEREASPEADVYALGQLWLYLLNGRLVEPSHSLEAIPAAFLGPTEQRPAAAELACGDQECFEELVGRHRPLQLLERWWNRVTAHSAVWVGLRAPSGQGKTSLLRELTARLWPAAWGQAVTLHSPSPLEIFHSMAPSLQLGQLQLPAELLHSDGWISARASFPWLPGPPARPGLNREPSLLSLAEVWFELLRQILAQRGRQLLIIDDLQWADPQSLILLQLLAQRHLPGLMVVLAWRTGEFDPPVDLGLTHHLQLEPLQLTDLQRWARRDGRALTRVQAHCIHDWSRGSPLLLRDWLQTPDAPLFSSRAGLLLQDRLSLLSADGRRVLETAGLLGKSFPLQPLKALHPAWQEALEEGCSLQLLLPIEGEVASFAHDRVREHLLAGLSGEATRQLHGQLADYFMQGNDPPLRECVHHLTEAGRSREAAGLALCLARQDTSGVPTDSGRKLYEIYLQHFPQDELARFEFSRILRLLGRNQETQRQIQEALKFCREPELRFRFLAELLELCTATRDYGLLQECARECLQSLNSDSLSLYLHCRLYLCFHSGSAIHPLEVLGLALYGLFFWRTRLRLSADLFTLPPQLGWAWGLDYGRRALERAVDRNRAPGPWAEVVCRANAWRIGLPPTEDYLQLYLELQDVLSRYSSPVESTQAAILLCLPLLAMGRFAQVERIAGRLAALEQADPVQVTALHLRLAARGERLTLKESQRLLEAPATASMAHAQLTMAVARSFLRRGQPVQALEVLQRVARHHSAYDHLPIQAWVATAARRALEQTPRSCSARRRQYRDIAWKAVGQVIRWRGIVYVTALQGYRERAWLYLADGDCARAREAFREAAQEAERCRATFEEALSRRDWGLCGARLGWSEAQAQSQKARDLLNELGAWWELSPEGRDLPLEEIGEIACEALTNPQDENLWAQVRSWDDGSLASQLQEILTRTEQQEQQRRLSWQRWSQENELWKQFLAQGPLLYERRDAQGNLQESNLRQREFSPEARPVALADGSYAVMELPPRRHSYQRLLELWEMERQLCLGAVEKDLEWLRASGYQAEELSREWLRIRQGLPEQDPALQKLGPFPADVTNALSGVLREARTNSRKHGSDQLQVEVAESGTDYRLITLTDSSPTPSAAGEAGFGLESMRFRLSLVGGELAVEESSDLFRLWIRVPTSVA